MDLSLERLEREEVRPHIAVLVERILQKKDVPLNAAKRLKNTE
jgi:hypothetical protein